MKRITVFVSVLLIALLSACSTEHMIQRDPVAINVYGWSMPVSQNLNFKNLLPENVIMILVWDADGNPKYLLVSKEEYAGMVTFFNEAVEKNSKLAQNRFIGIEMSVTEIEGLSFLTDEQLRDMTTEDQKRLAEALNPYKKYTLMSRNLKCVLGYRDKGKYFPDFQSYTYQDPEQPQTNPSQSNQQQNNGQSTGRKPSYFDKKH